MKSFLTLIVLCLALTLPTEAQLPNQAKLDSLAGELKSATVDTARARLMFRFGAELLNIGMMDSARVWFGQALELAERTGHSSLQGKVLNSYGISYFYMGDPTEAEKYWKKALQIAEANGEHETALIIQVNLANAQQAFGNFPAALDLYFKILPQYESANDQRNIAMLYGIIGVLYGHMKERDKAIGYLQKAIKMDSLGGYNDFYVNDLCNIGNTYIENRNFGSAEYYLLRALDLSRQANNPGRIGQTLTLLANLHMEQFHLTTAIAYLNEANEVLKQIGDYYTLATNQGRMAIIYTDMTKPEHKVELDSFFGGDKRKALDAAQMKIDSALSVMLQSGDLPGQQTAYQTLAVIHEGKGDYAKALENFAQYKMISDSLFNIERDKKITQTAMQYEFDKQQAMEQAQQEKKDARQATIRNSIASVLGGSLIFLFVVVRQRNWIKVEKKRSDDLLLNILPGEVADELKAKGTADAKHFDRATILFTDFKNFTQMSEKMSPTDLVDELNNCFREFDHLMATFRIEKIKTIGDAYMAAGGLPDKQHGSPSDVVKAALRMQEFMERHKAERQANGKPFFEMRCGIHTGPVVAGIVGVKKFQYDIWGDTVNMASRMESSGEVGQVNISEATYLEVKDTPGLAFQHRGKVAAKGKGDVDMWFVREA